MKVPAPYSDPKLYNDYYTYHVPGNLKPSLTLDTAKLTNSIHAGAPGLLRFGVGEGNSNTILWPLYDIHRERYVVYSDLINKEKAGQH